MTRREFLFACVVLCGAWLGGWALRPFRAALDRLAASELDTWPRGLLDCLTSSSVHEIRTPAYVAWS